MRKGILTMTTKRKPYVREIKPSWWQNLGFYKFYIFREATCLPTLWFSLLLTFGVIAMGRGQESAIAFLSFLQNPIVLLLNIITLVATLFHAKTWFDLVPKAVNLIIKGEKFPNSILVKGMWVLMVIATIAILALALF